MAPNLIFKYFMVQAHPMALDGDIKHLEPVPLQRVAISSPNSGLSHPSLPPLPERLVHSTGILGQSARARRRALVAKLASESKEAKESGKSLPSSLQMSLAPSPPKTSTSSTKASGSQPVPEHKHGSALELTPPPTLSTSSAGATTFRRLGWQSIPVTQASASSTSSSQLSKSLTSQTSPTTQSSSSGSI